MLPLLVPFYGGARPEFSSNPNGPIASHLRTTLVSVEYMTLLRIAGTLAFGCVGRDHPTCVCSPEHQLSPKSPVIYFKLFRRRGLMRTALVDRGTQRCSRLFSAFIARHWIIGKWSLEQEEE